MRMCVQVTVRKVGEDGGMCACCVARGVFSVVHVCAYVFARARARVCVRVCCVVCVCVRA